MDVSIGAVGASLIAGLVSLLGLVISKEQKTSEFRQQWIDSLRGEITVYLTSFNAICDFLTVKYADQAEKVSALQGLYAKYNEAAFAITLRVNPKEIRSAALISCMSKFNTLAAAEHTMTSDNIRPLELELLSASKALLKYEWKRVKRGEITFVITKIISGVIVILCLAYLFLPFLGIGPNTYSEKISPPLSSHIEQM